MRIVQVLLLIFLFAGCLNEPDCLITSTNLVKINFKRDAKTAREITFTKINVTGLTKNFYAGQKVTSVQLPVDPNADESVFEFYFEGRKDTILFSYKKRTEVISVACGAFTNYSDLSVSESTFELFNITITNNQLLINATSNVEVFVK